MISNISITGVKYDLDETTKKYVNMLAALDIVEAKLASQLHKYKETNIPHVGKRGILARFKRSYAREAGA